MVNVDERPRAGADRRHDRRFELVTEIERHRLERVRHGVFLVTFHGVIEAEHSRHFLEVLEIRGEPVAVLIADARGLERITTPARRVRADRRNALNRERLTTLHVVVANSVVTRAMMTTQLTAVRLLTKRDIEIAFVSNLDDALARALTHAASVLDTSTS